MKKSKKMLFVLTVVLAVAISITVFAASAYNDPAEAVADLTGKTVDEVIALRQETGTSYCEIAADAGKLDEFKAAVLEIKKDTLAEKVANGILTQERATEIIKHMEQNQQNCDGTRQGNMGQNNGTRQQNCNGTRSGQGAGTMAGSGTGKSN